MAQVLTLNVVPREKAGKGSARAARRAGLVPAVIYGAKKAPVLVSIKRNELAAIISKGGFLSHQFELVIDGGARERVLPRDVQLHPVTDVPLHVDFLRLAKGSTVTVAVPVHFLNHKASPGLKRGGVLNIVRHEVELEVPADAIPEALEADLTGLEINDTLKISAIALPEGCRPTIVDRDFTIATIAAPSALRSEGADEENVAAAEKDAED